jgi:hypothetical protein
VAPLFIASSERSVEHAIVTAKDICAAFVFPACAVDVLCGCNAAICVPSGASTARHGQKSI